MSLKTLIKFWIFYCSILKPEELTISIFKHWLYTFSGQFIYQFVLYVLILCSAISEWAPWSAADTYVWALGVRLIAPSERCRGPDFHSWNRGWPRLTNRSSWWVFGCPQTSHIGSWSRQGGLQLRAMSMKWLIHGRHGWNSPSTSKHIRIDSTLN